MKLTSYGAAGEVTGSQHLIETGQLRLLLDCGLYQGPLEVANIVNAQFPFKPKELDAVILSHAHLDHCGKLPVLVRQGFRGPILTSAPTADLAEVMLIDSARIQQEDTKLDHPHTGFTPLYDEEDVTNTVKLFEPLSTNEWHDVFHDLRLKLHPAGHILGASISELQLRIDEQQRTVIFTGDLGRRGAPLLPDPGTSFEHADIVVAESTYGNRIHASYDEVTATLKSMFQQTSVRNGCLLIPAFSLGRTQQLLFILKQLYEAGDVPSVPVYVDSPLANRVTRIYRDSRSHLNPQVQSHFDSDEDPFSFPELSTVRTRAESMQLNDIDGPLAIIAGSGMCDAGRIVHHLKRRLPLPNTSLLLMGFQAEGTRGRQLQDGCKSLRVGDRDIPVNAQIESVSGLSAHADAEDLRWWFSELLSVGGAGEVVLVHGEDDARTALASLIESDCNSGPRLPQTGESIHFSIE